MTANLTDLDACDDVESVRELVETCVASMLCGNDVRGHASISSSWATQLDLSTETPETNPGDIQNQGKPATLDTFVQEGRLTTNTQRKPTRTHRSTKLLRHSRPRPL